MSEENKNLSDHSGTTRFDMIMRGEIVSWIEWHQEVVSCAAAGCVPVRPVEVGDWPALVRIADDVLAELGRLQPIVRAAMYAASRAKSPDAKQRRHVFARVGSSRHLLIGVVTRLADVVGVTAPAAEAETKRPHELS